MAGDLIGALCSAARSRAMVAGHAGDGVAGCALFLRRLKGAAWRRRQHGFAGGHRRQRGPRPKPGDVVARSVQARVVQALCDKLSAGARGDLDRVAHIDRDSLCGDRGGESGEPGEIRLGHVVQFPGDPNTLGLDLGLLAFGNAARDLGILLPSGAHTLAHSEHDEDAERHGRDARRRHVESDRKRNGESENPGRTHRDPGPDARTARHR